MSSQGQPISKVLDLGCGRQKVPGSVGVDRLPDSAADVVHDLDQLPYPFHDNEFDQVIAVNVLEHVADLVRTMEEIHRICKPGAVVYIAGPHFTSCDVHTDPTHRRGFTSRTFDYWVEGSQLFGLGYSEVRFRKRRVQITFWGPLKRALGMWFNKNPLFYERHLAYICPAHQIIFELEVVKP